jgi:hypothetical protein
MREKPLLLSDPMVLKTIERVKDVTRRSVNPQPPEYIEYFEFKENDYSGRYGRGRKYHPYFQGYMSMGEPTVFKKPTKYAPGDRLWVRETWCRQFDNTGSAIEYLADWINKDTKNTINFPNNPYGFECPKWRPSIFMPHKAARLFLYVVSVRIERLHELDDTEAQREGFKDREDFIPYWNKLNEKRGFPWADNPWVYRVEYKVAE